MEHASRGGANANGGFGMGATPKAEADDIDDIMGECASVFGLMCFSQEGVSECFSQE